MSLEISKEEFDSWISSFEPLSNRPHNGGPGDPGVIAYKTAIPGNQLEDDIKRNAIYSIPSDALKVIAYALNKDVRALLPNVRQALLAGFPNQALFDSGAIGGKKHLSEEQICTLLYNLFLRTVSRVNFTYCSALKQDMWGFYESFGASPLQCVENPKGVRPCDKRDAGCADRVDVFGNPSFGGECTAVAHSFCELLFAFGLPFNRLRVLQVGQNDTSKYMVASRSNNQLRSSQNIFGIQPVENIVPLDLFNPRSKGGCDRVTSIEGERLEEVARRKVGGGKLWLTLNANDLRCQYIAKRLTNTLVFDAGCRLHPCNIDVFTNHLMVEVLPVEKEKPFWVTRFYDPLYELRYKNGPMDYMEVFQLENSFHPESRGFDPTVMLTDWGELGVEEWRSVETDKRRLYSIPLRVWKYASKLLEGNPTLNKMRFLNLIEAGVTDEDKKTFEHTSAMGFFPKGSILEGGQGEEVRYKASQKKNGFALDDFLFFRHHKLYIYIDERHWAKEQKWGRHVDARNQAILAEKTGHPYQIVWLLEVFLNLRGRGGESETFFTDEDYLNYSGPHFSKSPKLSV